MQCCPRRHSWDNIAIIKILCNVVLEAPDKNALEKILFNIVVILLGQHCTSQNPMQCCPRGFRQNCTGKNRGNMVWTKSGHSVIICIRSFTSQKKCEDILPLLWKSVNKLAKAETSPTLYNRSAFYPTTCQTSSQTLSRIVKLSTKTSYIHNYSVWNIRAVLASI